MNKSWVAVTSKKVKGELSFNLYRVLDTELDVDGRKVAEEEDAVVELGREEAVPEPEEDG